VRVFFIPALITSTDMNFGVIGTAGIARIAVVPAIQNTDHRVLAIASRDRERAESVADELDVPRSYGSYEELLKDDDIDAVYNPLPNSLHAKWTKRAADAGLDVLCEKPLGVDAAEAREMGEYCETRDVTLMEAFMYRYHPRTERVVEIVEEELDEIRSMQATFQFPLRDRPDDIRLNPDLAGGSLMDVGCYAVNAVRHLLGEPESVYARTADARDSGVDTHVTGLLEYDDALTAQVSASFDTQDVQRYRVEATNGWLEVESAFVPRGDDGVSIEYSVDARHVTERFDPVDQYRLEVEHFAECVHSGRTPRTDAEEATRNMAAIDALYESARTDAPVTVDAYDA
jgi:xylose dehydrogenase (NAD/NADP)